MAAMKAAATAKAAKATAKAKAAKAPGPKTPPAKAGPKTSPLTAPVPAPAVAGLLPKTSAPSSPQLQPAGKQHSHITLPHRSWLRSLIAAPPRRHCGATWSISPERRRKGRSSIAPSTSSTILPTAGVAVAAAAVTAAGARRKTSRVARRATGSASERRGAEPITARAAVTDQLVTSVDPSLGPQGTYQVGIDFKNWLQSADEELKVDGLRVEGHVPAWLRGYLEAGPCLKEAAVIEYEKAILKLRSQGAPGAGLLYPAEQSRGLEDFAVAFGGGGVRSGSIAASGFASFLVKAHREGAQESNPEQRYRAPGTITPSRGGALEVVADFIERSQRNAGYLVSFNNLWKAPD
eukprot:s100_g27.t1